MTKSILTGALLALLITNALAQPPHLADPEPGQVFLTPQIDLDLGPVPLVVPERYAETAPAERELMVPPGFAVNVFAAGAPLEGPRFMALDPEGVLHVANMKAGGASQFGPPNDGNIVPPADEMTGQIIALPDRDGDGVADTALVVVENLWWANNFQFYKGELYVGDRHAVRRFADADGDGVYETEKEPLALLPPSKQHRTRTIVFDEQNDKLYVSIGSTCDICREEDPERAAILEFNADGTGRRIFATGLRNAVGLALHPVTNQLWATGNGHDREGSHLPPELVTAISDGDFFGWPLAFGFRTWVDFGISTYENAIFPITAQDSANVERMSRPTAMLPAHLAPMAIHFYIGDRFSPTYRNAAFVASRGGSNAAVLGNKVVALFADPDGQNARVGDFLTGFQPRLSSGSGVWGRPTGLTTDARGALYVSSDWTNHMILRVVASPLRGTWEQGLPDEVIEAFTGGQVQLRETIRVEGIDPDAAPLEVVADLSAFGGPEAVPLESLGDGTFGLQRPLDLGEHTGVKNLVVRISQQVEGERFEYRLRRVFELRPGRDLVVMGEELAPRWQLTADAPLRHEGFVQGPAVFRGAAAAFVAEDVTFSGWNMLIEPQAPIDPLGYGSLRFAFHPGNTAETAVQRIVLTARPGRIYDLIGEGGIDLSKIEWQEVEIPLAALELTGPIEQIRIQGSLEGRFFIDELRFETLTPQPAETAVAEGAPGQPDAFALAQNFPNPFNAETVIGYTLARAAEVELNIYNLAGQRVVSLVRGFAQADAYEIAWDGRDEAGRALASGMYIYCLQSDNRSQTRKLLLLR